MKVDIPQAMAKYEPEAWLDLDLTISQLKSLLFIESEGATNAKSLATALRVTPPDVTRIIDHLTEQELVSRRENPKDRRMLLLQTTEKGRVLLAKLREHHTARLAYILIHLSTEELAVLSEGLTALLKAIRVQRE